MAPSQSLLPFLFLVSSFTPSLCPHLSKHFIPGCKAGAASALQGKASLFPSTWMSGTEAASPTQSLVSLPKGPRQIQFEAASRHMLCAMFYLCLAPRALRRCGWVVPLLPRSNLHADLIPLPVLSTPIR